MYNKMRCVKVSLKMGCGYTAIGRIIVSPLILDFLYKYDDDDESGLLLCSGKETEFHIEPELTLELMMAANYLHT